MQKSCCWNWRKNHKSWYPPLWRVNTWFFLSGYRFSFFWVSVSRTKYFSWVRLPPGSSSLMPPCVDKIPLVKPKDWGFILIGLSLVFILFWLSLQWIITQDLEVQMFHFSYSKPSRAFNKLNWAYAELVELNTHRLHSKTCIHLVVNQSYHNYSDNWCFIQHKDDICVFSSCDAFSLFSHKFVWMMSWSCSLI